MSTIKKKSHKANNFLLITNLTYDTLMIQYDVKPTNFAIHNFGNITVSIVDI